MANRPGKHRYRAIEAMAQSISSGFPQLEMVDLSIVFGYGMVMP
jgi:hypothetical protein